MEKVLSFNPPLNDNVKQEIFDKTRKYYDTLSKNQQEIFNYYMTYFYKVANTLKPEEVNRMINYSVGTYMIYREIFGAYGYTDDEQIQMSQKLSEWFNNLDEQSRAKVVYWGYNVTQYYKNPEYAKEIQNMFHPQVKDKLQTDQVVKYITGSYQSIADSMTLKQIYTLFEEMKKYSPKQIMNFFEKVMTYLIGTYMIYREIFVAYGYTNDDQKQMSQQINNWFNNLDKTSQEKVVYFGYEVIEYYKNPEYAKEIQKMFHPQVQDKLQTDQVVKYITASYQYIADSMTLKQIYTLFEEMKKYSPDQIVAYFKNAAVPREANHHESKHTNAKHEVPNHSVHTGGYYRKYMKYKKKYLNLM